MTPRSLAAAAAPLEPTLCDSSVDLEPPRIDLFVDQALLPPTHHLAHLSSIASRSRVEEALNSTDAIVALEGEKDAEVASMRLMRGAS